MIRIQYLMFSPVFFLYFLISQIICDINIHIIPHTHLDPGWIMTAEEYYNMESIVDIFNTITNELYNDSAKIKTFVINELYYFKTWYEGTNPENTIKIKELINEKRLEFVSGGFVVNDEATPYYKDIIEQIRVGHQFILEEFGITPKTAWYIDSFGHSAGNAYLTTQFNYENLVLGRMHLDYLDLLKKKNSTEFYWQPFDKNISTQKIFTHILPIHYGFRSYLKELGNSHEIFIGSVKEYLLQLFEKLKESYIGLKHKNIMFLFGDDFQFKDKNLFSNLDSLINAFNNSDQSTKKKIHQIFGTDEKINFFYSTPERYFEYAKRELKENGKNLETLENLDFYPLKTDCFWTGYFTSRPYLKGYIKKASNAYYALSKYIATRRLINEVIYVNQENNTMPNLNLFREVVSLNQHHDAITGTCKQYVSDDYISGMEKIIAKVENNFKENIEDRLKIKIGSVCYNNFLVDQKLCSSEFMIASNIKGKDKIKIGLYNPLIAGSSKPIKLLINIEIFDSFTYYEIEGIKSDFFCVNEYNIKNDDYFRYKNKCFLNFFYEFKKEKQLSFITIKKLSKYKKSNKYYSLNNIKNETNIELIQNKANIKSLFFNPENFEFYIEYYNEFEKITKLNFTYYDGMYYVNADQCMDGAYQFSPYHKYPEKIELDYENSIYFIGNLGVTFITRNLDASFTFFTIFYNPFFAKVEHFFDNVEEDYFLNKYSFGYSFVLKTNINNLNEDKKPIFYTDTNGLEMMKREIDKFNYNETADISIGANFYPVSSAISIKEENNKDNNNIVTVFSDRPQAGTSMLPGSIILVIQRMSYGNDNKGMPENLWENQSMNSTHFKTTHFILFGLNIYKEKNKKSNMAKKTDLLNFIYNYFNTGIFMFKVEKEGKKFKEKISKNNGLVNKMFENNIKISPDIRASYQVIHKNLIIGEYFRYNNYYFNINQTEIVNQNEELTYGSVSLNFQKETHFKIFYDKTGINYSRNETNILYEGQKEKLITPKNENFKLNYNEFLFIYFYFDNEN